MDVHHQSRDKTFSGVRVTFRIRPYLALPGVAATSSSLFSPTAARSLTAFLAVNHLRHLSPAAGPTSSTVYYYYIHYSSLHALWRRYLKTSLCRVQTYNAVLAFTTAFFFLRLPMAGSL